MSAPVTDRAAHRSFLNRYYGLSRHFYDATRKYYLFGRDVVLDQLVAERWTTLVEIGPGTGRNLRLLHEKRPDARLGGVEASDAMLTHARERCAWASLVHGFAEDADLTAVLGVRPDRILFSYVLSMVGDPGKALDAARAALAPGGEVVVVDFGDMSALPGAVRRPFRGWLGTFHVEPPAVELLRARGATLSWGPGRYYVVARLRGPDNG